MRCRNLFRLLARLGTVRVVLISSAQFWKGRTGGRCGGFEVAGAIHLRSRLRLTLEGKIRREIDSRFINTQSVAINDEDREWLGRQMKLHDVVWIHGLQVANGCGLWHWPSSVLDVDDLPSTYFRSMRNNATSIAEKLRFQRLIMLWARRQHRFPERFNVVSVCSESDAMALGRECRRVVIPNGFNAPTEPLPRRLADSLRLGFIGKFDYEPNRTGVQWFVEHVWSIIRKRHPDVRRRLVGDKSEYHPWRDLGVDGLGWVADPAAEISSWSLMIVPVRTGGGTRINILDAFSRRCPVVSTP